MTRRALLSTSALLVAALAPATSAAAASKAPVVKSITPLKVAVGQQLTLKGKNFLPGKGKTRVFFVRMNGAGVASAAADKGTRTKVVVTVPAVLNAPLAGKSARFKVRVLAKRFGAWSKLTKSPVITAAADGSGDGGGGTASPEGDCDKDGVLNGADADDDNDLLTDAEEKTLGTDACKADTEGDGVEDGYEYKSAVDLNETVLFGARDPIPYPGKRPYPNPLFPDSDIDFDGDGLPSSAEQSLWLKFGNHELPLNYSAGLQTSVPTPLPADPELEQLDSASWGPNRHDGWLDDGERDADGDGLANWDEFNGRMTPMWWELAYNGTNGPAKEKIYPVSYAGTDMVDADSDGDGVPDGRDDQDFDGLTNQFEVTRPYNWESTYVSLATPGSNPWARVNPFNPCKPVYSKTCHTHPPFGYYDGEDWDGLSPDAASQAPYAPHGVTPGPIFAP
jgi:hypothetical protein